MAAVNRHLPPRPGVTEIRVHGVGGTPPEALLEQSGVTQITGDDKAGFYRGAVPVPGRTVEAYSWGGLTTRSRSRALWILLLPFSLVNLAGWMVEPRRLADGTVDTRGRTLGIKVHESFVQLVAIATTALYVVWAALLSVNTLAFQCAAIVPCRQGRWYLDFLGTQFFAGHPGKRILVGLVPPLLLLGLFAALGIFSRRRYDTYGKVVLAEDDPESGSLLGRGDFWYTAGWQQQTARLHVAMVLFILSGLLGRVTAEFSRHFGIEDVPDIGGLLLWTSAALAAATVAVLIYSTFRSGDLIDATPRRLRVSGFLLAAGYLLTAVAVAVTSQLDVADEALSRAEVGADGVSRLVPVTDLWGFGWAPILLLAAAILFVGGFSVVQLWRWLVWRQIHLDQMVVVVALAFIALWESAPWVAAGAVAAAGATEVAQWWAARSRTVHPYRLDLWKLAGYLVTVAVGTVAWLLSGDAAAPYGHDWPRLTPLLAFSATLLGLNLWALRGKARPAALLIVVAAPAATVAAGYVVAAWSGRDEFRYAALGLALLSLCVVRLAQHPFDGWRWNGPAAISVLALAIIMGAFSGGALRLADFLDRDGTDYAFRATAIYEWLVIGFVAFLLAGILGLVLWLVMVRLGAPATGHGVPRVTNTHEAVAEGLRAIDVTVTVIALAVLAGGLSLVVHLVDIGAPPRTWVDFGVPRQWSAIVDAASWISLAMIVAVFAQVRSGLRDPASRRRLGTLWDVASFWPRTYHPFAPPAYASRGVPELQSRLVECATGGGEAAPGQGGTAIVSAHSQGTVLSLAAVASLPLPVRRRVHLVTHGSPLRRFYQRFFPRYFPPALFLRAATTLGPGDAVADGGWLNFWRATDPIADPVFRGITARGGTLPEALVPALEKARSGLDEVPDVLCDDPLRHGVSRFQASNPVRGHPGYMADPAMAEAIAALAGGAAPPGDGGLPVAAQVPI